MISVIIPAFNAEKYLSRSIESVLSQSADNWEIIVVDDGSTDNTPTIINQYSNQIRFVKQANLGLAVARNTGIRSSNGEFIALLDSDDIWHPHYLEKMSELFYKYPDGGVYLCGAYCIDEFDNKLPQRTNTYNGLISNIYFKLLYGNFIIPSTTIIRRHLLLEAGLFDPNLKTGCEDWDLWLRISEKTIFVGLDSYLVDYRIHPESMSRNLNSMHKAAQKVILKHFGADNNQPDDWKYDKRRAYAGLYRYMALTSVIYQDDWKSCEGNIHRSLAIYPDIAKDVDLFYELSLGNQPIGTRNQSNITLIGETSKKIISIVNEIPTKVINKKTRLILIGTVYFALGLLAYNSGHLRSSRFYLIQALKHRPQLVLNKHFLKTFVRCIVPSELSKFLRSIKPRLKKL